MSTLALIMLNVSIMALSLWVFGLLVDRNIDRDNYRRLSAWYEEEKRRHAETKRLLDTNHGDGRDD
jgi:hypothetical protein